jgi:hypothetical protein
VVLHDDQTKTIPVDATPPFGFGPPGPPAPEAQPSARRGGPTGPAQVTAPPAGVADGAAASGAGSSGVARGTMVVADEPAPLTHDQRRLRWFILALIAVAAVTAVILVAAARKDSARGQVGDVGAAAATTAAPATSGAAAPTTVRATPRPAGDLGIVSAAEFDPPPGDGRENPEQLGMLTDGKANTQWSTVCYRQRRMTPKQGVGFVLLLSGSPGGHHLVLSTPNRNVEVAAYVARDVGDQLRDWGKPVSRAKRAGPGEVELDLGDGDAGRYVLVWFTDLGEPSCSSLPFQVRVGEVTLVRA